MGFERNFRLFGWVYRDICHRPLWPCATGVHVRTTSRHLPSGGRQCGDRPAQALAVPYPWRVCVRWAGVVGRVRSATSVVGRKIRLPHLGSIIPSGASGSAPRVLCWMCPIPFRVHFVGSAREPGSRGSRLRVWPGSALGQGNVLPSGRRSSFGKMLRSRLPADEGCPGLRIRSPRSSRGPGEEVSDLRVGD